MSNKDTTELDRILYKHTANYSDWLKNNKEFDSNEAREALLLWRDTEVIKEISEIKLTMAGFTSPTEQAWYKLLAIIDERITQLQSNLKERE